MKKKGRVSLVLGLILLALGLGEITLGVLESLGLLSIEVLSALVIAIKNNFALFLSPYSAITPGILLVAIATLMLSFRNRKPFSHFYEIYLIIEYITLGIILRTKRGDSMPSLLENFLTRIDIANKFTLLCAAFALEVVLGISLLYLASFLDSSWRRKRDFKIKKLIHDGLIPSKEDEEAEKERIHQEKLNAIEDKKMKRIEEKTQKDRERAEKAEAKRQEKEDKRDKKSYEKEREKAELLREKNEEKERKREERENDKKREQAEVLSKKELKKKAKEEKRKEKLRAKENKKEKEESEEELPPLELGFAANPNNPLEFPSFSEMPELKTLESYKADDKAKLVDERHYESNGLIETIKAEEDRMNEIEEDEKPKRLSDDTTHFTSGGMLEATIEAYNSNKSKGGNKLPPQRPIIGYDEDEDDEEAEEVRTDSFAPSNLSPDHPRYKLFEALQHKTNTQSASAAKAEDDSAKDNNIAPSNLSPEHPRYKLFESLSKAPEAKENPKEAKPSVAPSNLSPAHPRYKLFEALKKDDSASTVSHFPGKSFVPEEDDGEVEILKSTYEAKAPEKEKSQFIAPSVEKPAYSAPVEEKPSYSAPIEKKPVYSQVKENYEEPKEEAKPKDSDIKQENELELSVGIGGLSSNNMGFYAIKERASKSYAYPPVNLLKDYQSGGNEIDSFTRHRGEIIVEALKEYRVDVELFGIIKGPTVTMYELKLGVGTVISKVTARESEINYALGGSTIRILAPIPGMQAVGIEVPNAVRDTIGFKDMIYALRSSEKYKKFRVPMILGKTITGEPIVIDVAKMPHMIIAGTTGSGKSVCINSFINTILYQKSPKEVRLVMVDPKTVELSMYNGIPHLLTPVITEAKRVVKMLNWMVEEMDRRYQVLARFGVRNIEGLNEKLEREHIAVERMPYIVLIMDEFADMMTVVGKDIETMIARLTAKARAAGIHLILATQRPSTDVITGTIKSNLPARIAFAVSSGTNSRVILDQGGAESLLGKGDMLLLDPSARDLQRIQGAFLSDGEVDSVSSFAREHAGESDYLSEDIFEDDDRSDDDDSSDVILADDDSDEALYEQAKQICFDRKCASASYLQRRMKIGYNRAARLIEMMEEDGIVGEAHGSKPREILRYE